MRKGRKIKGLYPGIRKQPNISMFRESESITGIRALSIDGTYRPVCNSGHNYLGGCMSYDAAWDIAMAHQRIYKHKVDAESC